MKHTFFHILGKVCIWSATPELKFEYQNGRASLRGSKTVQPKMGNADASLILYEPNYKKGALDSPKEEVVKKGIMIDKLYRYLNNLKICKNPDWKKPLGICQEKNTGNIFGTINKSFKPKDVIIINNIKGGKIIPLILSMAGEYRAQPIWVLS